MKTKSLVGIFFARAVVLCAALMLFPTARAANVEAADCLRKGPTLKSTTTAAANPTQI